MPVSGQLEVKLAVLARLPLTLELLSIFILLRSDVYISLFLYKQMTSETLIALIATTVTGT